MLKTRSNRGSRLLPIMLLAAVVLATGCESVGKQDIGMGIDAAIGAFFGYQLDDGEAAGTVAGAIVDGFVGRAIGQYMDETDRKKMARTLDHNVPGEASSWRNPETGYHCTTTPTYAVYPYGKGQCRDLKQEMIINGECIVIDGNACKRSAGESWQVI